MAATMKPLAALASMAAYWHVATPRLLMWFVRSRPSETVRHVGTAFGLATLVEFWKKRNSLNSNWWLQFVTPGAIYETSISLTSRGARRNDGRTCRHGRGGRGRCRVLTTLLKSLVRQ